jgi:hypothetical protein
VVVDATKKTVDCSQEGEWAPVCPSIWPVLGPTPSPEPQGNDRGIAGAAEDTRYPVSLQVNTHVWCIVPRGGHPTDRAQGFYIIGLQKR